MSQNALDYALEKLSSAVHTLAKGRGTIKVRLTKAYDNGLIALPFIMDSGLPNSISSSIEFLWGELRCFESSGLPKIDTNKMTVEKAEEIAGMVVDSYTEIIKAIFATTSNNT